MRLILDDNHVFTKLIAFYSAINCSNLRAASHGFLRFCLLERLIEFINLLALLSFIGIHKR